jgi:hypothetical protein
MSGITQGSAGVNSRLGNIQKTLLLTAALMFLGIVGVAPVAAAQGFGQGQGNNSQNQGALSQNPDSGRYRDNGPPMFPRTTQKQRQALLDYNFKKLKQHADDLKDLASSLQKEIEKSNENVLSLEIVKKAEQVEKLAKKIKEEAKGY